MYILILLRRIFTPDALFLSALQGEVAIKAQLIPVSLFHGAIKFIDFHQTLLFDIVLSCVMAL